MKKLSDSLFVISGIIKASISVISVGNTYLEVHHSGYHKKLIQ